MSFNDIFGHEKQIRQLKTTIANDRLPHAFLFYGMEGIGKRTTALIFAKALNCLTGNEDACNACDACLKADHNNHPDLIILEAEGQFIKIQAIRALHERMKYKPWEGKKRVCIIIDAERMNDAAANALLKTLEEPPPSNIIILVTARPYLLPATIISRCQQLRFSPLPEDTVASFLEVRLSLDMNTARLLASSSGGSIARAQEMQKGPYLSLRNELLTLLAEGHRHDLLTRLSFVSSLSKDDILERLNILRLCYHDAMLLREGGEEQGLKNQDRLDIVKSLSGRLATQDIIHNIKTIEWASQAVEQHADKTLTLEVMVFKLKW